MTIIYTIKGQVRGGKNSMVVTRTGKHYPRRPFTQYRDAAYWQILEQRIPGTPRIEDNRWLWTFDYTPADRRRHDAPAILDAVFHVLEKALVVSDDSFIKKIIFVEHEPDRENPRIEIQAKRL